MINKITKLYYDTFHPDGIKTDTNQEKQEPISITMLLRLLQNKHDIKLGGKDELIIKKFSNDDVRDYVFIDLSKGDLLRDQDEEVIEKIGKLLNIK